MAQPFKITSRIRLRDFNPAYHAGMDKDKTREKTARICNQIGELQQHLYANHNHSLILLFQGMDTSGKDGAGRHILESVTPAGVETTNFKTPSSEELAHDFLWRVHKAVPRHGNIGVFNRSHYEDVLVVRVLKLQPSRVWRARYDQINAFEKHLAENNVVILKFFLHINREEQGERLKARIADPRKNWKFQPEDLKMRALWKQFQKAYEDALNNCSTHCAPWHLIPAGRKWYRDYSIAKTVVKTLEDLKLDWPKPRMDLTKFRII